MPSPNRIAVAHVRSQRWITAFCLLASLAVSLPAHAARPLLDQHQWDRAFALFARDSYVPWRPSTVRLETYSSAPVDFKAFAVDAPDVIVAGHPKGRVYDTRGHAPIAHWRFFPPAGYRVEGNTVPVPLGSREGVFVVEARRGSAVEQVWINRTRVGLISKESPDGLLVYGTDLHTGQPLRRMRLLFLVGSTLATRLTDGNGLVRWSGPKRPRFVLAEWGSNRAFLSFLPQAPVPHALAVVRVDRAVVRGGEDLNVVGFARRSVGSRYASANGSAHISLLFRGHEIAAEQSELDSAGAFHMRLHVPKVDSSGQASILVNAAGASAGTGVQIDAAGDLTVNVSAECQPHCAPDAAVPLLFETKRLALAAPRVPLSIRVVRYPHIFPPGTNEDSEETWGATTLLTTNVPTNASGRLRIIIPAAADGLPSTFGIQASTHGNAASASTRLELPNSAVALEIRPEHDVIDVGQTLGVNIRAFSVDDGRPVRGAVTVTISHGPNHSTLTMQLDRNGRGRVAFHQPQYGANFIAAKLVSEKGIAMDENVVTVEPRALSGNVQHGATVTVDTNRNRYRPHDRVDFDVRAPGAVGQAFITIDHRSASQARLIPISQGVVQGGLTLNDPQGAVEASVAYVREGYVLRGSVPLNIDGPGHERSIELSADQTQYASGTTAKIAVHDGAAHETATTIVRLSDEIPSGGADFESAGDVLAFGGATTQSSATDDPPWHAWVSPQNSRARDLFTDINRRPNVTQAPALIDGYSKVLMWRAERIGSSVSVALPKTPGRYILSVLRMYDDGDVGAATLTLEVV